MGGASDGRAIWVVGLPGCGKSTLVRGIRDHLLARGIEPVILEMDQKRKEYFPEPAYTAQERERAYAMFVDEAAEIVGQGRFVIMDGSAYKAAFREYARQRIPRFAEIFLRCRLETAMEREANRPGGLVMAGMYQKALRRRITGEVVEGLGEVIGVDVPFEESPHPELLIDNSKMDKTTCLGKVLHFVDGWVSEA
ncbi:adenylyl-sulfate kinase [Pseudodesulfovibrio cashew]|uniref:Adenylyl-sulfate kinase n=1 Tax=Pseudodesulfovibrio cashew TaxID=2678688 RepID=A0A6I6JIT9_9BACT|nr:adenylyl-sulfate kinase [Pseudodesulfovibrio cashew]QGY41059.1 adenylyl-sulfate kinase [Pseudodesulfovibrio cashew]